MAIGLKSAGLSPMWAVDSNADACSTYRRNVGSHAICNMVEEVDFSNLHPVSGLAFGFPWNDFSLVGERRGVHGYFGGLYKQAARAVATLMPDWFIAENVPGLMTSGGHRIMQECANLGSGYNVSVHLFKFEEYGVAQRRSRVIAVGIRQDLGKKFYPPAPSFKAPIASKKVLDDIDSMVPNQERTHHTEKVKRLLEAIPPGENCWHDSIPEELRLNVKNVKMSLIYRRLHPDLPSYTIVGSGGGGTHGYHYDEPRALTNRERARLQSFDDNFTFEGGMQSVRKQIGMAVPPLGAEAIGQALMNP
jgi:DNA (cytosine-5)-methyltransferase 1